MDNSDTLILASAAYADNEIAAEFGLLPPTFLPFGHDRLYMQQVKIARKHHARVVLSLPADFEIPDADQTWLRKHEIEVCRVPPSIGLGDSILFVILTARIKGRMSILHGDTLFDELPIATDVFSVHEAIENYKWGYVTDDKRALTGYFSFSDALEFARSLILTERDFVPAVALYRTEMGLNAIEVDGWRDFGHLQSYYHSRSSASTERSFNSLSISRLAVEKVSKNTTKVLDEALWYERLPPALKNHTPAYLGRIGDGYKIAYQPSPTLHELFVFGTLGHSVWNKIAEECFNFLAACQEASGTYDASSDLSTLLVEKTERRLAGFFSSKQLAQHRKYAGVSLPSVSQIVKLCGDLATASHPIPGVMHGDFCLPNIFYDFRSQIVKVIDPRGSVRDGEASVFGDLRYDLAKLNHSLEGYDHILAGRYRLHMGENDNVSLELQFHNNRQSFVDATSKFRIEGRGVRDQGTMAATVLLFLSMIPLHSDRPDRQTAFLANALRLYTELESKV